MRRRILLTLLASTSIVLFAFLVPLMVLVEDFAVDRAQRQVVLEIQPVISRIPVLSPADSSTLIASFTAETGRPVTLYLARGATVGSHRPLDQAVELARERGAFFTEAQGGRDLLIPIYTDEGEAVLRVFVSSAELTAEVTRARLILGLVGGALLALSVGLGLWLARSFLRPIAELSSTADELAAGELTARVPPTDIQEIASAGTALNRLAGRVKELLGLEREEVADLAHRLRTPVTALRLNVDTLPLGSTTDRLRADVDQLEWMVDEVIREARRPVRADIPEAADLFAVTRERAAFWAVLAEDQDRPMRVDVPAEPLHVCVEPRDLADALDALLGNVFSHTPEGVAFQVSAVRRGDAGWVEVGDGGPGIAAPDALERGRSAGGSTGLGLDIARRVAERAGGKMVITTGSGDLAGAHVSLRFELVETPSNTR